MKNNIWLFGGGGACSWLMSGIQREGLRIEGILDENTSSLDNFYNKTISGISFSHPDSKHISAKIKQNSCVVIGVLNPSVDTECIKDKLISFGWGEVILFSEWTSKIYKQTGKCVSPLLFDSITDKEKIGKIRNDFSDEKSVKIFDSFLEYIKTGNDTFDNIDKYPYFPEDIEAIKNPINMIDCGSYNGDTILELKTLGYHLNSVHAFEPDSINYEKLCNFAKLHENIFCWPNAVSDKNKILKFNNQSDQGSFVDDTGDISIQSVLLDDCLFNYPVNFIKMDIEGSEFDALLGAEKILKKYRPRLAISVYHKPDDIWKIHEFLRKIYGSGSRFYLRHHSRIIADTVLYVIP